MTAQTLTHLDVDALGVTIRIDLEAVASPDRDAVVRAWSGARTDRGGVPSDTLTLRAGLALDEALADLTTRVTLAALTAGRRSLWMVHAGAVADLEGRVVLFSGPSGMGKTTLMSQLCREYGYVTDESVGVTSDGRVLPYRKPLSVIHEGFGVKRQLSPNDLGLKDLTSVPLRLHAVVILDRDAGHDSAGLDAVDVADALRALAPQCSYLADLPAPLQTFIGHIERTGGALRLRYREAAEVMPLMRALFGASRPASPSVLAPEPAGVVGAGAGFSRRPVLDAVTVGRDRLAFLRRGAFDETVVHLLGGIGPTLWRAADNASLDELVERVVCRHGQPVGVDAREAVTSALAELCRSGLIEAPQTGRADTLAE